MKSLARILSLLLLVSATLFYNSCKEKETDPKSAEEVQIEKLVGTWNTSSVKFNSNATTDFSNFKLTLAANGKSMTFTTTGRPTSAGPWDASGTLTFDAANVETIMIRNDGAKINYTVSGSNLQLTLENYNLDPYYGGRTNSVAGNWVFELTK